MHWRTSNEGRRVVYPIDDNPMPFPKYPPRLPPPSRVRSVVATWLFVIALVFAVAIGLVVNVRADAAFDCPRTFELSP